MTDHTTRSPLFLQGLPSCFRRPAWMHSRRTRTRGAESRAHRKLRRRHRALHMHMPKPLSPHVVRKPGSPSFRSWSRGRART